MKQGKGGGGGEGGGGEGEGVKLTSLLPQKKLPSKDPALLLLKRKRLLLSEKYKAITVAESGTKPSNLDILQDLHDCRKYLLLWNCFKSR